MATLSKFTKEIIKVWLATDTDDPIIVDVSGQVGSKIVGIDLKLHHLGGMCSQKGATFHHSDDVTVGIYEDDDVDNQTLHLNMWGDVLKRRPGHFMYSSADLYFYFFKNTNKLYIIPLTKTRDWISANKDMLTTRRDGAAEYIDIRVRDLIRFVPDIIDYDL